MALAGNPGDVFLRKTSNQIPVACRTYNVTLGVSGDPVSGAGNVDVVIEKIEILTPTHFFVLSEHL